MTSHEATLRDVVFSFELLTFLFKQNKSNMAEVAPRESIMSLVTETSEQRRVLKSASIAVEPVVEDSVSCFNCTGNVETVEDTTQGKRNTLWCPQLVNSADKQAQKSVGRQSDESNEEKPNLKRRNNSLEESLVEGEGSLKKMKITAELQDGRVTA